MADQIEEQDVELTEDESVEEAHDPKNAEQQSIASVDKAGGATGTAKLPNMGTAKNNTKQDPMQKIPGTKAGMINAMHMKMNNMSKAEMSKMYSSYHKGMGEDVEADEKLDVVAEKSVKVEVDFKEDLNALVESEATLSDEFKAKTATIFEAAVNSKVTAEIEKLEENYKTELEEELKSTREDLIEKVDSYLNYVVENWMEENKVAIHNGLRTEIAEDFMNKMKDVFIESYIEVPESKVDLVDDLATQVEDLEERLNVETGKAISVSEELENLKREAIIREASKDLAETQVEKLHSLTRSIEFESEENFIEKVNTVKESYFKVSTPAENAIEDLDEDTSDDTVEVSGSMASYISAMKKINKPT